MEKIRVEFSVEADESFQNLKKGSSYFFQLAVRYYNNLFDFPPEAWGGTRRENGTDTFVSDKHIAFDVRGIVENTKPTRPLYITHFELRKKIRK